MGDKVLKEIVEIMQASLFSRDVLCRYGGDEFALLLTKTSDEGIYQAVEKIRKEIAAHVFIGDDEGPDNLYVTISAGLATLDELLEANGEEILKLADDRLLEAKNLGRNRVVHA